MRSSRKMRANSFCSRESSIDVAATAMVLKILSCDPWLLLALLRLAASIHEDCSPCFFVSVV